MVEEGTFPIKSMYKAIIGSVVTCGVLYVFFFFALAGMGSWDQLTKNGTEDPFVAIKIIEDWKGWKTYALFFGVVGVFFTIGTCLLGFWYSTVRLIYAMGRQNFLPKVFAKTNRFGQPILPNLFILGVSFAFFAFQSKYAYLGAYLTLMAFACASAYAISMCALIVLAARYPNWERPFKLHGGQAIRVLAFVIALAIAVLCALALGQKESAWHGMGMYMGIGAVLWLWMIVFKWSRESVWMKTPDGVNEY